MILRIDDEVSLQPLAEADAQAYFALAERSRSELAPWLPWMLRTRSADDITQYQRLLRDRVARGEQLAYAVLVRGSFAGAVDVHDVNPTHAVAQIGYWLGTPFVGRGIMTRAVREAARVAFRDLDLHRLEVLAAVHNARSRAVAVRAGFAQEAVLRRRLKGADGWDDAVLYVRFGDHV